jgi:hypothetical protein
MMKSLRPIFAIYLLASIALQSCNIDKKAQKDVPPLKLPPSNLSFNVHFPASELAAGVTALLKPVLIDDEIRMNDKGDILYLKVIRTGKLNLSFANDQLIATLPLDVSVAIKKKMMGITFSNKDTPINFNGKITTLATANLDAGWNFVLDCQDMDFEWDAQPSINIMGLEIDLSKTVKKALDENEAKILNEICGAINKAFDFRITIDKVWKDMQKPIRISQKPTEFWLKSNPEALNAQLLPLVNDTLSIHLEYKSDLYIETQPRQSALVPLPDMGIPLSDKSAILAYLDVRIPISLLNQLIPQKIMGRDFTYKKNTCHIENAEVDSDGQKLRIKLKVTGDFDAFVTIKGKPVLTRKQQLTLTNFEYEIDSENKMANAADWFAHNMIEGYITDEISIDLSDYFLTLDEKLEKGIEKSPMGNKITPKLKFTEISEHQQRISNDTLQWILYAEGAADLILNREILVKKK